MTLLGVGERIWRKEVHWRLYVGLLAVLLMCSFYISWREAQLALNAKPPSSPEFTINERDPKAREELEKTKEKLATTQGQLEDANKEIAQLKQHVEDRVIQPEDSGKIIAALRNAPKGTVIVKSDWMDGEAIQFAHQIKDVLRSAGYSLLDANCEVLSLNDKGTYLIAVNAYAPPKHADPIYQAFKTVGIEFKGLTATPDMRKLRNFDIQSPRELTEQELMIWVTRKP